MMLNCDKLLLLTSRKVEQTWAYEHINPTIQPHPPPQLSTKTLTFLQFRALEGAAAISGYVAICSLGAKLYPHKLAMVIAGADSAFYSGFALGPTIGSFLYDVAGFHLPFVTLGSLNIAFSCIMSLGMPKVQNDLINSGSRIFHSQIVQVMEIYITQTNWNKKLLYRNVKYLIHCWIQWHATWLSQCFNQHCKNTAPS